MAKVIVGNSVSIVSGVSPETKRELERMLVYKSKGYQFTQAFKDGRWDGNRSLFWGGSAFPAGLTGMVADLVSKSEGSCEIVDSRLRPESGPGIRFAGQDREYQYVEDVCVDSTRGIINFATGSGKTAVAARIIARLDVKTLYIVPSKELLYQTQEELERFLGIPIGVVGDTVFDTKEYVTVATIQTLWSVGKKKNHPYRDAVSSMVRSVNLLFIDEAQYLGADTYFKTVQAIDCYYKFGLTGTAFRADDAGILLQAATGRVIAKVSSSDLIKAGVLAKTTIKMHTVRSSGYLGKEWMEIYDNGVVKNEIRNRKILELVSSYVSEGKSVMVIVKSLDHGEALNGMIPSSIYMHGSVSSGDRLAALDDFRSGRTKVLIGTKIYDEGVNIPCMDVLILAAGGTSPVKSIQRVGRALRKTATKDSAVIVDFIDQGHKTLFRHSNERMKAYRTEPEFKIEVVDDGV